MRINLQKGGVILCFFILYINVVIGQTAAYFPTLPPGNSSGTAGKAVFIASISDIGNSRSRNGIVFSGTGTEPSAPVTAGPDANLKDVNVGNFIIPFVKCDQVNINYTLVVQNISTTKATNESYKINWGDNTPAETFGNTFDLATHTYTSLGTFDLVLTVTGANGTASKTFKIYNGRIPNLTMGSPDHSGGCAPQTYTFPIGGIANNPPDTKYTFTFDDGTPPLVFTHENIPSSITHIFDQSSCSRPGDVFTLKGRAENFCSSTEVTVVSRKIGARPKVNFTIPQEIVCTEQNILLRNTTAAGSSITNTGECDPLSVYEWKIEPATGWTLAAGNTTSKNITVRFTETGSYKITLISGNDCGSETITKEVQAVLPAKAGFTIDQEVACKNLEVKTRNTSEGPDLTYSWEISPNSGYTLLSGTLTSANPVFRFTEAGKYTISLSASTGCTPNIATQEVVVKEVPLVSLPEAQTYCSPQSIKFDADNTAHTPAYDANSGTISGYTWSLSGNATFVAPTHKNSQFPEISFPEAGTYTVSVTVTNECGVSEEATQLITIDHLINNTLAGDQQVCYGEPVSIPFGTIPTGGNLAFTFLWESSTDPATTGFEPADGDNTEATYTSGPLTQTTWFRRKAIVPGCDDDISNVVKVMVVPDITGNLITGEQMLCENQDPALLTGAEPAGGLGPGSFTYTWEYSTTGAISGFQAIPDASGREYKPEAFAAVTWFRRKAASGNCEIISPAVRVTINPLPDVPEIANTEVCAGSPAALKVASHNGTCEWFSDETSTKALHAGDRYNTPELNTTTTFYIQFTNASGCSSPRTPVTVTVHPFATLNTISANQLLCIGEKPAGLTGSVPTGGNGVYTYLWEQSTDNITYTPATGINNAKDYQPPLLTQETWYRRLVISNKCENYSDPVQVMINNPISNNSISLPQSVCTGAKPAALTGSIPTGGGSNYTYFWEYSTTDATTGFAPAPGLNDGADYIPGNLTQTTWFRRKVISLPCQENTCEAIVITVEPQPPAPYQPKGDKVCPAARATLSATTPLATYTLQWFREAAGGVPLHTGATYITEPLLATTDFYVQMLNQIGCPGERVKVTATVVEPLVDAGPDVTVIAERGAQLTAVGGDYYSWSPATSLSDPNIPDPVAKPEETTTYTVTVTTPEGCSFTDEVTVSVLPKIMVANAMTVNGDGLNDTWFIENIENYPNCHIQVFTRWGAKVFESVGYQRPWDGTHQGRELPMSAYYYIIKLNDKEDALTGSITLIR